MWGNVPSDICTQRTLKLACAFAQTHQNLRSPHEDSAIQNAPSEDSDQTERMRSLIWIFAGRTSEGTFADVAALLVVVLLIY